MQLYRNRCQDGVSVVRAVNSIRSKKLQPIIGSHKNLPSIHLAGGTLFCDDGGPARAVQYARFDGNAQERYRSPQASSFAATLDGGNNPLPILCNAYSNESSATNPSPRLTQA